MKFLQEIRNVFIKFKEVIDLGLNTCGTTFVLIWHLILVTT